MKVKKTYIVYYKGGYTPLYLLVNGHYIVTSFFYGVFGAVPSLELMDSITALGLIEFTKPHIQHATDQKA